MKVSVPARIILLVLLAILYQRGEVASDATESFSSQAFVSGMPPACICATPSSHPCLDFDCRCECNVNINACDDNCCCDPDCGQDDKSQFSIEVCPITAQQTTKTSNLGRMCYDDSSLIKINPKYPLQLDDTVEEGLSGLLCLKIINNGVKGTYLVDPGYPSPLSAFSFPFGQASILKTLDYNSYKNSEQQLLSSAFYRVGAYIPLLSKEYLNFDTDSTSFYYVKDLFRLPISSNQNGLCHYLNAVEFRRNVVAQARPSKADSNQYYGECVVQIFTEDTDALALYCQNEFNIDRYVKKNSRFIGTRPNSVLSSAAIGTLSSSNAMPDSKEFVLVEVVTDNQDLISTEWNNATSTCTGALYSLQYTIRYNSEGMITKVVAKVKSRNISFLRQSSSTTLLFRQLFSIEFLPEGADHVRRRSGNPGYIMGSAVLGAYKISPPLNNAGSELQNLNVSESGLLIMDSGHAGLCDSASPFGTVSGFVAVPMSPFVDTENKRSLFHLRCSKVGHAFASLSLHSKAVTFREDTTVGCLLSLTREELKTLCTNASHPFLYKHTIRKKSLLIPVWLRQYFDFVGIFGNADPSDIAQWLPLYSPLENNNDTLIFERNWIDVDSRCDGIVTRTHYKFLWTYVGSVNNPQAKIISSYVEYDQSEPIQYVTASPQERISFPFVTTVTWIYVNRSDRGTSKMVLKKPPKLLFSLPPDIFYPFSIGSGNNQQDISSLVNVATSVTSNYSSCRICSSLLYFGFLLLSSTLHLLII